MALAESCTGGMVASAITDNAGASGYFKGGVVAYSNEVKERILGVSRKLLQEKGAVSAEVAEKMAAGAARLYNSECCIALSGIAGPAGGSPKKPIGLVFIGICFLHSGNRRLWRRSRTVRQGADAPIRLTRPLAALNKPPSQAEALDCQIKTWSFEYRFKGNRKSIREQATTAGLEKMIEILKRQSRKAMARNLNKKMSIG